MLLPKGLPVVYVVETDDKESMKNQLQHDKISAHITDQWIFICGFVVGDTENDGLSVVSLDNPEICLITRSAGDDDIETVRQYILDTGSYDRAIVGVRREGIFNPICQFS